MWLYRKSIQFKKKSAQFWYFLMTPIAYFYTKEKMDKRYNKKVSKITEEKAIRLIAKSLVKYLISKTNNGSLHIIIADYFNEDDFWGYTGFRYLNRKFLKNSKTSMAYYKYKWTIDKQLKVLDELRAIKGIVIVEEELEMKWRRIDNFHSAYKISYKL